MRRGFVPDMVVGTSIGALIGAMIAAGRFEAFDREISAMSSIKLAAFFTEVHLPQFGLLSGKPILEWLEQSHLLGRRTFSDLETPFAAVATDLDRERSVILREGPVAQAVRASISIPGIFDPVVRNCAVLVDGGLVSPVPVKEARALGAEVVVAVDINTQMPADRLLPDGVTPQMPTLITTLLQTMRMVENEICRQTLTNDAPEVLIRPAVGHLQTLEFHTGKALITAGERAVVEAESALGAIL
jgi:NTE family protein